MSRTRAGKLAWESVMWLRFRVGSAILGGGWFAMVRWYALVVREARECITPDGQVILANCKPLADTLYGETPGEWKVEISRSERPHG